MAASRFADVQDALTASDSTLSKGTDGELARELTGLVEQIRREFAQRDLLYQYIDNILFRNIPVTIPDAFRKTAIEVHSPLPQRIANYWTAALSINPPAVQFQPIGFGQSYQENATEREHFFDASWKRQEEEAKQRLFRKFMYSLVTKGEGCLKTVERAKTAWASYDKFQAKLKTEVDEPDGPYQELDQAGKDQVYNAKTEEFKRGLAYPIRTMFVAPETFFYNKGEDGFTVCAEVKQVPYLDALERFGYALDSRGKVVPQAMGLPAASWPSVMGKNKTLTLAEVWLWEKVYYLLFGPGQASSASSKLGNGTLAKTIAHGYGDPTTKTLRGPYFHCLGLTTDSPLPDRAGLGVLYGYLDLFPLLDSLLTIRGNAAFLTGFPAYKHTQPPGATLPPPIYGRDGSEQDGATTTITPGTIYPYDVDPIQQPAAGPEFNQFLQELRLMLSDALPNAAQGQGGADQSGYALNQSSYLARLAADPIVDNAEIAMGERVSFESWLIENKIGETVYVWGEAPPDLKKKGTRGGWLGMGPPDLNGCHRYNITLNPETPSNRIIDIRTHQEMLTLRLEMREDAITQLGGNPDEVERSWLLYDLKQDPAIKQEMRERVFSKLATIDQKALGGLQAMQQEQQGAAGGLGGGLGGTMANTAQVFQPGQQGQPLTPTPAGSVAGAPGPTPNAPPNALPLAGQGPMNG